MSRTALPRTRFDVAIVGGGPSGSVAAALLAARGARVILFDPSHPREKPCGGGVTQRALALLRAHLGITGLQGVEVRSVRFLDGARRRETKVRLDAHNRLLVVRRDHFDGELLAHAVRAGALFSPTRVADIELDHGVRIATSDGGCVLADQVIGADGPNSLVRRRLGTPFGRSQLSIGTGVYADSVTSDEIVLEMISEPPGYVWSFPRLDHLAVGICAQASETNATTLQTRMKTWLETSALKAQLASSSALRKYSWPIPSLTADGFDGVQLGGSRWLTVGDAAGLVDPITREGIFFALQSGIFAADALTHRSDGGLADYDARVRAEIIDDLRIAASLKTRFFAPSFTALLTDALDASERIRSVMADLISGAQPYRTLKRRLLGTLEIGLAWRLLRQRQRSA